jgi:hypothetical protein
MLVNGTPAQPFTIETIPPPSFDYAHVEDLKELSYQTYGKAREEVEAETRRKFEGSF